MALRDQLVCGLHDQKTQNILSYNTKSDNNNGHRSSGVGIQATMMDWAIYKVPGLTYVFCVTQSACKINILKSWEICLRKS